ncbi:MAG: hypothetical protein E1N59_134 [Puniceicoccaceae bacterium 5H]|nr:MAG: hypothetical protein E1N59_134 [Puniceicoccaceae bacterium 5H]
MRLIATPFRFWFLSLMPLAVLIFASGCASTPQTVEIQPVQVQTGGAYPLQTEGGLGHVYLPSEVTQQPALLEPLRLKEPVPVSDAGHTPEVVLTYEIVADGRVG